MERRNRYERHSERSYYQRSSPQRDFENYDRRIDYSMPSRMQRDDPDYRESRERTSSYDRHRNKEEGVLYFSDCIMFPPNEDRDRPVNPRTPKPKGCRTIYLGGIPEVLVRIPKRLESILTEVFHANGGEIDDVRISGKGFCHIRFRKSDSIERAMSLCGYWMEVKQGYEPVVRFRIMADYAESQLDQEEYETKKLIANRLNLSDTNIPAIPQFNTFEVEQLTAKLKNRDTYMDAIVILRYWMSSHLNKQTSVRFFNVLQATSGQIKRLQSEKQQLNKDYETMMEQHEKSIASLDKEFDHLMNLYEDAHKQKAWDNFTKPQRKSIDGWLESVQGAISINDTKGQQSKAAKEVEKNIGKTKASVEIREVKPTYQSEDEKIAKINSLQESLDAMQKQVWEMVAKLHNKELEIQSKQTYIDSLLNGSESTIPAKRKRKDDSTDGSNYDALSVKIMCALTTFLHAYPKGATMECIENYLVHECKFTFNRGNLESKLIQMSDVFSKHMTVENDKTVAKWKYVFMT